MNALYVSGAYMDAWRHCQSRAITLDAGQRKKRHNRLLNITIPLVKHGYAK